MARGTQHRKRRPAPNARTAAVTHTRRQKPPQWQEQLFFQRLRNHAKWAYVGLAVAFVLGFVLLGVGSGSTGISDVLGNAFSVGSGGGTSISWYDYAVKILEVAGLKADIQPTNRESYPTPARRPQPHGGLDFPRPPLAPACLLASGGLR